MGRALSQYCLKPSRSSNHGHKYSTCLSFLYLHVLVRKVQPDSHEMHNSCWGGNVTLILPKAQRFHILVKAFILLINQPNLFTNTPLHKKNQLFGSLFSRSNSSPEPRVGVTTFLSPPTSPLSQYHTVIWN